MAKAEISSSLPYVYVLSLLLFIKILPKKGGGRNTNVSQMLWTSWPQKWPNYYVYSVTFPEAIVFL